MTLLEELPLRTSRITPMMRKLQSMARKTESLQGELKKRDKSLPPEEAEAMKGRVQRAH